MVKKKRDYSALICQDCLSCAEDSGFDRYMFHFVDMGRYLGLFCEQCIKTENLIAKYPYYNKPKPRSKKSDK